MGSYYCFCGEGRASTALLVHAALSPAANEAWQEHDPAEDRAQVAGGGEKRPPHLAIADTKQPACTRNSQNNPVPMLTPSRREGRSKRPSHHSRTGRLIASSPPRWRNLLRGSGSRALARRPGPPRARAGSPSCNAAALLVRPTLATPQSGPQCPAYT